MEDKATYINNLFSAIADKYDFHNTLLSFNRDKGWRKFTVTATGVTGGERALDIATGTGKLAHDLADKLGESGNVIGIDFCQGMLVKATGKKANTEFVLAASESLPFAEDTFDCATIGFALRNVVDIEKTLQEATRVIKPGGKVVCLEFSQPRNRVFQRIYRIYLCNILPFIGRLLSGNKDAYTYLANSIMEFLRPDELKRTMEAVGLRDVHFHSLTFGITWVHVGTKG